MYLQIILSELQFEWTSKCLKFVEIRRKQNGTLSWSRCSFATHNEWAAHDRKVDGSNPTYGFYYNLSYNYCDFHNYYYY